MSSGSSDSALSDAASDIDVVPGAEPYAAEANDGVAAVEAPSDDGNPNGAGTDMDALVCRLCGSVLCVSGADKEDDKLCPTLPPKPPSTTTKKPKVKMTPMMLSQPTVRVATRLAMLTAVPGLKKRHAAAILAAYATFGQLRDVTPEALEGIPVGKKATLGRVLAEAVHWAMQ